MESFFDLVGGHIYKSLYPRSHGACLPLRPAGDVISSTAGARLLDSRIVSSSYSVIYTSALRQQSTSCSKRWSPLQTAAMICSKEGNFTSLKVLMIVFLCVQTLGYGKCSFETCPATRKPENHARQKEATQLLFLKVIYIHIQSKFFITVCLKEYLYALHFP